MFKRPGHGKPQREAVNAARLISNKDDLQRTLNAAIVSKITNLEKLPVLFQRLALALHAYKTEQTTTIASLTEQLSKLKESKNPSVTSGVSDFEHLNTLTSSEVVVSPVADPAIDADIDAILAEAAQVGQDTDLDAVGFLQTDDGHDGHGAGPAGGQSGQSQDGVDDQDDHDDSHLHQRPPRQHQGLRTRKDNVEIDEQDPELDGMPELQDARQPSVLSSRIDGEKPKKKKKSKKTKKKKDESSSSEED